MYLPSILALICCCGIFGKDSIVFGYTCLLGDFSVLEAGVLGPLDWVRGKHCHTHCVDPPAGVVLCCVLYVSVWGLWWWASVGAH